MPQPGGPVGKDLHDVQRPGHGDPARQLHPPDAGLDHGADYAFRTRDRNPSGHIASFASTFFLLSHDGANQPILTSLGIGIPGIDLTSFP
jgi:hypothetical protein